MIILNLRQVPAIHFHWVRGIIEDYNYNIEDEDHYEFNGDQYVELRIATPNTELGNELLEAINGSHHTRQQLERIYNDEK